MDLGALDNLTCHLCKYSRIQTASRSEALLRHTRLLLRKRNCWPLWTLQGPQSLRSLCAHTSETQTAKEGCIAVTRQSSHKKEEACAATTAQLTSKSWYCSSVRVLFATTRVRSPSRAMFPHCKKRSSYLWLPEDLS